MYLIMSFDFGGTSAVKIHCMTPSEAVGRSVYAALAESCRADNVTRESEGAGSTLVELIEVPDGFSSATGHTLFWGTDKAPKTILTNNA